MFKKNNAQSFYSKLIIVITLSAAISCSTNSREEIELPMEGDFEMAGLENQMIYKLKKVEDQLFSSTNSNLYKQEVGTLEWNKLLPEDITVRAFEILSMNEIIASFEFNDSDSITIGYTENGGESWQEYHNGFGGETKTLPLAFERNPYDENVIFARGIVNVAKSDDRGKTWESVFLDWGYIGKSTFIKINSENSSTIWAGGSNTIFEPILVRSDDGGTSWERLTVLENTETDTYDIAIDPQHSKRVIVGLGGGIRKSTNNGETFSTVFEDAGILTFTHSTRNPEIVYASGINSQGRLFFIASGNFGDTWETVEFEESPNQIHVNDMVSVIEDGAEVLYFATNKGVYSYTFEE